MKRADTLIVVSYLRDLPADVGLGRVVTADAYLAGDAALNNSGTTVINMCRSWRYLSKGYYVSLLADARGQTVLPTVDTIEALANPDRVFRALQEADIETVEVAELKGRRRILPTAFIPGDAADLPDSAEQEPPLVREIVGDSVVYRPARAEELAEATVYMGTCHDRRFRTLASTVFRLWPCPVLRIRVLREADRWKVIQVGAMLFGRLDALEREQLIGALSKPRARRTADNPPAPVEDKAVAIAVLFDEADPYKASSEETLARLERVAAKMGVHVHRIDPDDLSRVGDYDALFIRSLTGLELPAFRFALRAEALGMPVIDDTRSIIRCGNKVFLHELLARHDIPTPTTVTATRETTFEHLQSVLGLPFIVKLPDGSFSTAVFKVTDRKEYERRASHLFRGSPLLIAQAFTPTDFDWRVTTLGGRPLFAARYFMARGHWQIQTSSARGARYGKVEAVARDEAPRDVVRLACRASELIGDGLYGVDIKQTPRGPLVIEVNDNPNIDIGYEDAADGDLIYQELVEHFLQQVKETQVAAAEQQSVQRRQTKSISTAATASTAPALVRKAPVIDADFEALRKPIGRAPKRARSYRRYEVCGLELEYVVVDRDLNVAPIVEPVLAQLAGRPCSDVSLGVIGLSNELFEHVLEIKTEQPLRSLVETERLLVEGVRRMAALLAERFDARLLPTGMHPWFNPRKARLWQRSNRQIYDTYARLFDVHTHGWANVQATHVNLPLGSDQDAVAMMNAAALLVPYLPAIAASTPMFDGELQPAVDNRLRFILEHQARIPESSGELVPEYIDSLRGYRRDVLGPMYRALDRMPDARPLRAEFFNARAAVFKFSRESMEVRVLDTQECVKMDVAIAAFVRSGLRALSDRLLSGKLELPDRRLLVEDFRDAVAHGTAARVHAPFLGARLERDGDGKASVRGAIHELLAMARRVTRDDELPYFDLLADVAEAGSLSERLARALEPYVHDELAFTEAARRLYIRLSECLVENERWSGTG
jgi:glutathione synthase/RimK-type ligase-like ATP-grasp enzyme/gamma-glutamyl:cysteine ligase YbdK (ATP-grasp superfamily)